jgi:ketosteroid isomerase-like protein
MGRRDHSEAAIAATTAAFVAALAAGDAAAASEAYADDARLLPPATGLVQGRAAIERFWRAGVESGISELELDAVELERRHAIAYEVGRYALRLQPVDGDAVVDRGSYVLVHERQDDGSWRRALEMFSPSQQPMVDG